MKAALQQYGAIPWREDRNGRTRVLLVTSRERGRWIVPKGWPVEDRTPWRSAAREAFEEAGVIGEVRPQPLASYHYVKAGRDGPPQHRHVTLFALRVRGTLTNWPERGQRKRRWFDLDEAADIVDDRELAEAIRALCGLSQRLAEAPERKQEEDRADDRKRREPRPDRLETGAAEQDRLGEPDEMRLRRRHHHEA